MKISSILTSLTAAAVMVTTGATIASAESTLDIVKARGHVRCQVGPPSPGYYNLDSEVTGMVLMFPFVRQ